MESGSMDSHVCGFCARHFFCLGDFLAHKKCCEALCSSSGLLSPPSSNETMGGGEGGGEGGAEGGSGEETTAGLRCPLCPETPRSHAALDFHLTEAHEEARPLQCSACGARQPTRRDMAAHLRLHRRPQLRRPRSSSPLQPPADLDGRLSLPPSDTYRADMDVVAPDLEEAVAAVARQTEGPSPTPSDLTPTPAASPAEPRQIPGLGHLSSLLPLDRPLDLSNGAGGVWRGPELYPGMLLGHGLFPPLSPSLLSSAKDLSSDDDWESMMEVNQVDENEKIRQLVGDKPQPPVTDPNQCLICRRILSCKSALQMHYRTHTGERPFKCKICLRAFTTKGNLKTHMGVHRSKHPFRLQHQCPICQKRFLNSGLLHQHMRLHTSHLAQQARSPFAASASPLTPPAQELPPSTLPHQPPFLLGLQGPSKEEPEPPNKARKSGNPSDVLGFNPATLLPPNPFGAGSPFAGLGRLPGPLGAGTSGAGPIPTPPSSLPTTLASLPLNPSPLSSARRPSTTCNICFKTFACYSALEIHYRSHTGDKPFICPTCGRGFSTRGNMKQHLMTHKIRDAAAAAALHSHSSSPAVSEASGIQGGSEPLRMGVKEERKEEGGDEGEEEGLSPVSEPSAVQGQDEMMGMMKEEKAVKEERMGKEEEVSPATSSGGGLGPSPLESIRMMWAQTEPPAPRKTPVLSRHQCGVCFKHFSSSSALQIHMRTHTGDKPFKCNVCGRAFTTKGNLKVHMGTHMWNNPSRRGRRIFDFPLGLDGGDGGAGPLGEAGPRSEEWKDAPPPILPPLFPLMGGGGNGGGSAGPLFVPPVSGPVTPVGAGADKGGMEAMLWMWRSVCSVCQKVCGSSSELEEHLKLHLQAGPRLAAAQGLLQHQ